MKMQVILAGMNIDTGTIEEACELVEQMRDMMPEKSEAASDFLDKVVWSPESISAAYARISRNPAPAPKLRAIARREIESARKSNRKIIFGLGHSSVAEHAVFNFDILGISRLAMEEIEHHRLCSFTEKSQRYITLDDSFVVPEEIIKCGFGERFLDAARRQYKDYLILYEQLFDLAKGKDSELRGSKGWRTAIEGRAKEDARYLLPLAVPGQLGMTANARNIEKIIGRLKVHPLAELRDFALLLETEVCGIAPSLVKYTEGADNYRKAEEELQILARKLSGREVEAGLEVYSVRLTGCTEGGDDRIAAALLFAHSDMPFESCKETAEAMSSREKGELLALSLHRLQPWDPVSRAFEEVTLSYELVVSASCFAQLKRHRMATLLVQRYDPALGITVPPAVLEAGAEDFFRNSIRPMERLYNDLQSEAAPAADYALTNAHRRRVVFSCNLRELYHLARLRMDKHAQWDIRSIATRMVELACERMPLAAALACGKDSFEAKKKSQQLDG